MTTQTKIIVASILVVITIGIAFFVAKQQRIIFTADNLLSEHELELQVPLADTVAERKQFQIDLKNYIIKNKNYDLRSMYEQYIDVIGANGLIEGINNIDPQCHYEGHDLGKVIFSKIGTIGEALTVCQDACYSGCMHGVFMEAFKNEQEKAIAAGTIAATDEAGDPPHVGLDVVKQSIKTICSDEGVSSRYSLGDCAHGVGHAVMYMSDYEVKSAIDTCNLFTDQRAAYYCATGAYMEYVAIKGREDVKDTTKSSMYPCDAGQYPAACFFSKIGDMLYFNQQKGGKVSNIVQQCLRLQGLYRTGCFHGFGNGFLTPLVTKKVKIGDVCSAGTSTDQQLCIEGAMMRMGKYHYEIGEKICKTDLTGDKRKICLAALSQKMYGLDRPFELYLN